MQNDEILEMTSFLNSIPDCLTPIYSTESSNIPIKLYDGPVSIDIEGDVIESNAIITLEWLPSPAVVVQTSLAGFNFINFEQSPKIKIPCSVDTIPMSIPRLTISGGEKGSKAVMEGHCQDAIVFDECKGMKYVIFHLVNFINLLDGSIRKDSHVWKGRSIVNFDGWMLTIDSVDDIKQIEESLKTKRGYAITHVARLERMDGSLFSVEQAKKIIDGLYWFLSFVRGIRSSPILPTGFDTNDKSVWQEWQALAVESWSNAHGWLCDRNYVSDSLEMAINGFWKKWNNPLWNDQKTNNLPLRIAIHWLTSCNITEGGIEGSIILAQTGLELISWVHLVEDTKVQNKNAFDKLSASQKLEVLFTQIGIDTGIPKGLSKLIKLSSEKGWKNGPEAITGYRNTIVHPKRRAQNADVVIDVSWEILELSLWYLELSLLYLFDYQGYYVNRINAKWAGVVEKVPWNNENITPA